MKKLSQFEKEAYRKQVMIAVDNQFAHFLRCLKRDPGAMEEQRALDVQMWWGAMFQVFAAHEIKMPLDCSAIKEKPMTTGEMDLMLSKMTKKTGETLERYKLQISDEINKRLEDTISPDYFFRLRVEHSLNVYLDSDRTSKDKARFEAAFKKDVDQYAHSFRKYGEPEVADYFLAVFATFFAVLSALLIAPLIAPLLPILAPRQLIEQTFFHSLETDTSRAFKKLAGDDAFVSRLVPGAA